MTDPDYITPKEACAVIGGTKAISLPTFYRDPELRALIEHPTKGISRISKPRLIETCASGPSAGKPREWPSEKAKGAKVAVATSGPPAKVHRDLGNPLYHRPASASNI
jgi:hypothetical protein